MLIQFPPFLKKKIQQQQQQPQNIVNLFEYTITRILNVVRTYIHTYIPTQYASKRAKEMYEKSRKMKLNLKKAFKNTICFFFMYVSKH